MVKGLDHLVNKIYFDKKYFIHCIYNGITIQYSITCRKTY